MDKRNFAFGKMNFILLAIGMIIVIAGFILMSGPGSTETTFNPDIFSAQRIKVAPLTCLSDSCSSFMEFCINLKTTTKK